MRRLALGLAGTIAAASLIELTLVLGTTAAGRNAFGIDYRIYMDAARGWLERGQWFLPAQLAGPYTIAVPDVLYPPTLLWLLVPLSFLPWLAWYAVPVVMIAHAVRRLRPSFWGWLALLVLLAWPYSQLQFLKGNPVVWIVALTTLGVSYGWGGAFILLKPSLFPFALLGMRDRRWWLAVGLMALLSLPLLPIMLQYPAVLVNSRGGGLFYSLEDLPLMLVPLVLWASGSRHRISGREGQAIRPLG